MVTWIAVLRCPQTLISLLFPENSVSLFKHLVFRGISLLRKCVQQRVACGRENTQRKCRRQFKDSLKN